MLAKIVIIYCVFRISNYIKQPIVSIGFNLTNIKIDAYFDCNFEYFII